MLLGDSEVQRTMLELLNQLDGFEPKQNIKVNNTLIFLKLFFIISLYVKGCLKVLYDLMLIFFNTFEFVK